MICPVCDASLVTVVEIDGATFNPNSGDYLVCTYCRVILVFTSPESLRMLSDGEWIRLPEAERVMITKMREGIPVAAE